ncbi:MAG: hypothetical protein LBT00_08900 [Spirochaetaceae bacterium]|jgi:hypothetical protein|nr:hypothetical protein [Spirochaetaceae bacterium]
MGNTDNDHWKLYEASSKRIEALNQRQGEEDDKTDKWMMTLASGSFGLSFAFINQIVPVNSAGHIALLIAAWSCFLSVLVLGIIGFAVSSFCHSALAKEEAEMLALKYKGVDAEYKNRSIFFGANAVLGYASILFFISGSICLILFIAKNLL